MKEGLNTKKMYDTQITDKIDEDLTFVKEIVSLLAVISVDDEIKDSIKSPYFILTEAEHRLDRVKAMSDELWERYKKAKDSGNSKATKKGEDNSKGK